MAYASGGRCRESVAGEAQGRTQNVVDEVGVNRARQSLLATARSAMVEAELFPGHPSARYDNGQRLD